MRVLGLSAFHADSAAALIVDGKVVAASLEGTYRRRAHEAGFPKRAARECLERAVLRALDLDAVVYERKPLLEFERVLVSHLQAFPRSARSFARSMFLWLGDRLWMRHRIATELEIPFERVRFVEHLRCLAEAAWRQSPFESAAILVVDGDGEWATTRLARAGPAGVEALRDLRFPASLARVAAAVTQHIGLEPGRDSARVEGLAATGTPRFLHKLEALVPRAADGAHSVEPRAFRFAFDEERLFGPELENALGPARPASATPTEREADVAASLQALLEARVLELAHELARLTDTHDLCFTGALAMNRRLVARLAEDGPFATVFVPPAPDEASGALGAALLGCEALGKRVEKIEPARFPGPPVELAADFEGAGISGDSVAELAERLVRRECVAWVRGALEFGPESLGHRSVLRAAVDDDAATSLLTAAGRAESGREVCLLLPSEQAHEFVATTDANRALLASGVLAPRALAKLRALAPSSIAADGRVWARSVATEDDPALHALLHRVGERTNAPLLLHVTFAPWGGAAPRSERDAHEAFQRTALDALLVEDRLYTPE